METGRNMVRGQVALILVDSLALNIASEHVQIRAHYMAVRSVGHLDQHLVRSWVSGTSGKTKAATDLNVQVSYIFYYRYKHSLTQNEKGKRFSIHCKYNKIILKVNIFFQLQPQTANFVKFRLR